jgi:hypothetical protein
MVRVRGNILDPGETKDRTGFTGQAGLTPVKQKQVRVSRGRQDLQDIIYKFGIVKPVLLCGSVLWPSALCSPSSGPPASVVPSSVALVIVPWRLRG